MELIKITNLNKIYGTGNAMVHALKNINLCITKGEFVAIVGSSGSGKSTLMHILGGLDMPTEGEVLVDGININKLNDNELSTYRSSKVGFIFQFFNLIPILNVEENIILPCKLNKTKVDEKYKNEIIDTLDLSDRISHVPSELSGGQQQRVAIARALLSKPAIILADEPTGNLDSTNGSEVISLLKHAAKKYKQTVIIVTHDNNIAAQADRIITLKDGNLVNDEINKGVNIK